MAKQKRTKQKPIILTPKAAKELQEQIYWEILEQFLAAASDLYHWTSEEVVDFSARVNWYFSAQHTDRTLSEKTVHETIEANMELIMERTKKFRHQTNINVSGDPDPAPAAAAEPAAKLETIKAYMVEDGSGYYTICFAKNANAAKYAAISSPVFETPPKYTELRARRFKKLDKAYRGYDEMDFGNARDRRAAKAAGIEFMEG